MVLHTYSVLLKSQKLLWFGCNSDPPTFTDTETHQDHIWVIVTWQQTRSGSNIWTFSRLKNLNTPKKNFTSSLQSRLLPRRTQSTIAFEFFLVDLMDSWYCPTWLQKSLVWRTRTSLMFMSADPAILARELWMTEKSRREIASEECDALLKLVKLNC